MSRAVHVRIVTPVTTKGVRTDEQAKSLEAPGVLVSVSQITKGPGSIESDYEAAMAVPDTVAKIIEAEQQGADAVLIDCMGDPGFRAAREAVTIPVLGPSQTGMHVAAMLGHRFSVVTVLRRLHSQFENQAALTGLAGRMASCRSIDIPVLELEADLGATRRALLDEAEKAVRLDGADVILFGCTGLMGCATSVRQGLLARGIDVPVVDPIPTAVNMAVALVRSHLSHSALAFPQPPAKTVLGFEMPDFRATAAE